MLHLVVCCHVVLLIRIDELMLIALRVRHMPNQQDLRFVLRKEANDKMGLSKVNQAVEKTNRLFNYFNFEFIIFGICLLCCRQVTTMRHVVYKKKLISRIELMLGVIHK